MKIFTADRECGNIIDRFETIEDAMNAIKSYEEEDKKNGDYTPDFYDIVDENIRSLYDSDEMKLINYVKTLHNYIIQLTTDMVTAVCHKDTFQAEADLDEKKKKHIVFESSKLKADKSLENVKAVLSWANQYEKNCLENCNSENFNRINEYVDKIDSFKKQYEFYKLIYRERVLKA